MLQLPLLRTAALGVVSLTCLIAAQTTFADRDGVVSTAVDGGSRGSDVTRESADTGSSPRVLMCFGGLDDRKFVIPDEDIRNPDKQTSMRSCQLDGGLPGRGPQSPTRRPHRFLMG